MGTEWNWPTEPDGIAGTDRPYICTQQIAPEPFTASHDIAGQSDWEIEPTS